MKRNMGNTDRMIRVLIAIVIGILFFAKIIPGTFGYVLLAVAGIFLITSLFSSCPLYSLLGINTCKRSKSN